MACTCEQITTTKEAKKYYPLFGLGANVALIFSGQYVRAVSAFRASLPAHVDKWGVSLKLLMGGCLPPCWPTPRTYV